MPVVPIRRENKSSYDPFRPPFHAAKFNPSFNPPLYAQPFPNSSQFIRCFLDIKNRSRFLAPKSIVLQHPTIDPGILSFKLQHWLWRDSLKDEVIIAVRTVFIRLLELLAIFPEYFLAFLTGKCHFGFLE